MLSTQLIILNYPEINLCLDHINFPSLKADKFEFSPPMRHGKNNLFQLSPVLNKFIVLMSNFCLPLPVFDIRITPTMDFVV